MTKKSSPTKSLDVTIARRAIGLTTGMTGNAYVVAIALLEHFNRKTGQCDPSIARLAVMLEISQATVKRATKELCDERSLFWKSSHGGLSHRASYQPNWTKMRAIVASWEARMSTGAGPDNALHDNALSEEGNSSTLIPSTAQSCALEQLNLEPQTLLKKPYGINPDSDGACGDAASSPDRAAYAETVNGLLKGSLKQPKGGRSPSHANAARQQATKRLDADLISLGLHAHADAMNRMDEDMQAAAIDAEMRRRGAGLALLQQRLGRVGRGPPTSPDKL